MGEIKREIQVKEYDELFCTTVKEDNEINNKSINELLDIFCRQYPNDKELGQFIRKHYQK